MATANAVWGIDIGQCALKAVKLRPAEDGKVEAVAFDVIEHAKILSQPDADRDELIASALEKFASRNDWQGDKFVVGVPGQQTFARFCKMPPIDLKKDSKKIHDLVRYEASQQIPFDMNDVVWDYQVFASDDAPDIEVGIFAIRKDLIRKHLGYFSEAGMAPTGVQAIPAALYNFCSFDVDAEQEDDRATVIIDVGAQNTDLIIVEPNSAWTRNIPLGGNSFTEALVRAFKLSFAKAESLKRSAATSKYARQIFQAMRPVFAELVAEVQRSLGFYSSSHRDVELREVLALGNAFRLPGLQKYLENNLTVAGGVHKLEKFNRLAATATINAPQFTDNVLSFASAYGLGLQGLGLAKIHASLLPPELARIAVWRKKQPFFMATAASLLMAAAVPWVANALDMQKLEGSAADTQRAAARRIIKEAQGLKSRYASVSSDTGQKEADIQKLLDLQKEKLVLPRLVSLVHDSLPPVNPPELASVQSGEELKKRIESDPKKYARAERGQLLIESLRIEYVKNIAEASLSPTRESGGGPSPSARASMFGAGVGRRGPGMHGGGRSGRSAQSPDKSKPGDGVAEAGFVVRVSGRLLYGTSRSAAIRWLQGEYFNSLRTNGQRSGLGFFIPDDDPEKRVSNIGEPTIRYYHDRRERVATPGGSAADEIRDPVTGEDETNDWGVEFAFRVKLGVKPEAPKAEQ